MLIPFVAVVAVFVVAPVAVVVGSVARYVLAPVVGLGH